MKQTVNPVHLLYNNNRLHKHIVWAPCGSTFTAASDKTMNRNETEIKVEVREFGYHLVQWLKFVYHFFAETCRTSPKFLLFVHFFLIFKSFNWYL